MTDNTDVGALFDAIKEEYRAVSWPDALEGPWKTVSREVADQGRWTQVIYVVTQNMESGRYYQWLYREGLTEYQEDEAPEIIDIVEVLPKEVVKIEWVRAE